MAPSIIAGRYQVQRAVGRGGMGTVWLCTDQVLGREVAVKQVGHLPGESTLDVARALREARSVAALNHPNVVSIYDAIEEDDHVWLVMEYVPGRSLSEILQEEQRLAPARAAWIGAQVADGLSASHLRGTAHRDVKPGNILVTDNDHAKISDFGIARTVGEAALTQTGMVTGTPGYFSPQLARGEDPSTADDVWALGATLFAAVEGHPPFPEQGNALAQLSHIATAEPPRPELAGPLTEVIVHMMIVDPGARWSMADAAFHLHQLSDQQVTTATQEHRAPLAAEPEPEPEPGPEPGPEPRRRRRWPLAVLALAAAVAVAVLVGTQLVDDPNDGTSTPDASSTGSTSQRGGGGADPGPTTDPDASSPSEEAPSDDADSAEQFVADYYALLPDDTSSAWELLSADMQAEVGSLDDYEAFWATVDSVSVNDTTSAEPNSVDVALTYVTDEGSEDETRRLDLQDQGDGFLIVGDQRT
jgi:serine/threonine protein kinase